MGDGREYGNEEAYEFVEENRDEARGRMSEAYRVAKAARVGSSVECPVCSKPFKKRSYQHIFCSNKGRGNCKDTYWNAIDPARLERAIHFNK